MAANHSTDNLAILIQEFQEEVKMAREENVLLRKQNEQLVKKMSDIDEKLQASSSVSAHSHSRAPQSVTPSLQTKVSYSVGLSNAYMFMI